MRSLQALSEKIPETEVGDQQSAWLYQEAASQVCQSPEYALQQELTPVSRPSRIQFWCDAHHLEAENPAWCWLHLLSENVSILPHSLSGFQNWAEPAELAEKLTMCLCSVGFKLWRRLQSRIINAALKCSKILRPVLRRSYMACRYVSARTWIESNWIESYAKRSIVYLAFQVY